MSNKFSQEKEVYLCPELQFFLSFPFILFRVKDVPETEHSKQKWRNYCWHFRKKGSNRL
jgi:hypothetical protein